MNRRLLTPALLVLVLVLAIVGCGGGDRTGAAGTGHATANPPPFVWLAPRPAGGAWAVVRLPSGATLPRPPDWQPLSSDPGTASFAVRDARGAIAAYLNATPRQGAETLANWATFRIHHNADEGSRAIHRLAAAGNLRFRSGPGTCVIDQYRTVARTYKEVACLVSGPGRATVVVGAATPASWSREAPVIERAISAFNA